ncbi:hypothetical protein JCM10213_007608 [Rhodosporidiobolus nylandii]
MSAPPAELAVPSAPLAISGSASAPPPSPAPVPPRNYSTGPLILPASPRYAPNSTVPRFLRALAGVVLLGGSVAAAVGWVYRTFIYPRLVVALKARLKLSRTNEGLWEKLAGRVEGLLEGEGVKRFGGAAAVEARQKVKEEEEEEKSLDEAAEEGEKAPLLAEGTPAGGAEAAAVDPSSLPPAPQLLAPLLTPLQALSTALHSSSSTSHAAKNPSNLVQPQGTLLRSLVTFNEWLDAEGYAASTWHSYRGATAGPGGAGEGEGRRKMMSAVGELKAEVRSVKGALLNRRNFTQPSVAVGAA